MKRTRLLLISFLLTLAVWLTFAWPLPKMMGGAISLGVTKRVSLHTTIVHMAPGDHLQFVYYLWLASDFLSGHTRAFYNLYEFNTGSDADRYRPGSYYFPLSLIFSIFYWMGGRAFAWNMACFITLWAAGLFTWRLCRRYTDSEFVAGAASVLALTFPYQWIQLYGGSPAGFGMALMPMLLLGLDHAVRSERMAGGWLAGLALLFASMTDTHAMFFGVLITPCWCVVAFSQRASFDVGNVRSYGRIARALAPALLLAVVSYALTQVGTRNIQQSHAAGGRRISEVALFSPHAHGLWDWHAFDVSHHVYVGVVIVALLAAGLVALLGSAARSRDRRAVQRASLMVLLALGVTGVILLALGPFSPFDGRAFTAARKFIPNYTMIRQPAKIFVLMPAFLSLGAALALGALRPLLPRRAGTILVLAIVAALSTEYFFQNKLVLTRIDTANEAYAAAAADARAAGGEPRALIVPLWPGDSHYSSIYQHYVSLYRIRMINGYRPFVPSEYITDVFDRFRSVNIGVLDDAQLDNLTSRGITYVLLHEDLFPEKVSAFPVATTLRGLLNNPRLVLLKQDGPVWAFRILPVAETRAAIAQDWTYDFPARRLEAERQNMQGTAKADDATASDGAYVTLTAGGELLTNPLLAPALPDLRWTIRVRGRGTLTCDARGAAEHFATTDVPVDSAEWTWVDAPIGTFAGARDVFASLRARDGSVDVDMVKLVAGTWAPPAPGQRIRIPAPCFFHAGSIDLQRNAVSFVRERERRDLIFYGPKLPLPPAAYRVSIEVETDAPAGTSLGTWIVACPEGTEIGRFDVVAGAPAGGRVSVPSNQPLLCGFIYDAKADLQISSVTLEREP